MDPADVPVVHCAELPRWSDMYTPGYAQMTDDAASTARKSPFTYNSQINAKIAYWFVFMWFCVINIILIMLYCGYENKLHQCERPDKSNT